MPTQTLDIIIPCYNAEKTLARAIESALTQQNVHKIIIVDDNSSDNSREIIRHYQQHHQQLNILSMPYNSGAATARNWGALNSNADIIAFLDADDAYEADALTPAIMAFDRFDYLSLIRLALKPREFPDQYTQHPNFENIWRIVAMTVAGNMIFRRNIFLAAGGFPQHELFRHFGGEDAALGNAFNQATVVGTIFTDQPAGVLHYYHPHNHAIRILETGLFNRSIANIEPYILKAKQITASIIRQLESTQKLLSFSQKGIMPIYIEYSS